jgi:hypothetical protein
MNCPARVWLDWRSPRMGSAAGSSHWAAVLKLARRVGRPEVPGRFEEGGPVRLDASLRQPARTVRGQLIPSPACTKPTVVIRSPSQRR